MTSALPSLTLGEGILAGSSVTSIPTQSPILLAIDPAGGGAKFKRDQPHLVEREPYLGVSQASASPTATAASFAQNDGGSTGNNCGFATRYTLNNGMLQSGNDTVGKTLNALKCTHHSIRPIDGYQHNVLLQRRCAQLEYDRR